MEGLLAYLSIVIIPQKMVKLDGMLDNRGAESQRFH
jgi:hypothetical protein